MSPSHEQFRAQRTFGALDALRAVSILAVIWHHTAPTPGPEYSTTRGFLGVDLFFVISGFLIVTLLLRERERTGTISLSSFYVRRSLRIFPVYYAVLGLLSVLFLLKPSSTNADAFFGGLPYFLTYTSNWVHLPLAADGSHSIMNLAWSLASEEQFYLLWPPLERYFPRWTKVVLPLLLAVNVLLAIRVLWPGPRPEIVQITFFPILMGVALAHVLHSARGYARVARVVGARWSAPVWVVITLGLAIAPVEDVAGWPRLAIQTSMVVMLAAFVVREDHGLAALTRWAPLARLGVVSYGMYLFHMIARDPVVRVLGRLELESMWLRFGLTAVATWVVAELSFRYFEKRFLALKERFSTAEHKR